MIKNHYFTSETNQITSQSGLSQLTLIQGMFTKDCDNNTVTSYKKKGVGGEIGKNPPPRKQFSLPI